MLSSKSEIKGFVYDLSAPIKLFSKVWSLFLVLLVFGFLSDHKLGAARDCPPQSPCFSYIPQERLPMVQAQQTFVWCWAASVQTICRYYGFDIPQSVIVQRAYGTTAISTGSPQAMLRAMNSVYSDVRGRRFQIRTIRHLDAFSWMTGDRFTASLQTGLTNFEIFNDLAHNRPVFYCTQNHAMVLVGGHHVGDRPLDGWVLDPAPSANIGFGPITSPNVPAIGLRQLRWNEMSSFFAALVRVEAR